MGKGESSSKKVITKEEWEKKLSEVKIRKEDMNRLVMNFLVTEGYVEAAEKFQRESGTQHIDLGTITDRMAVRKAVQCGQVEDVIEKVNDLNPEQRLIELIRAGKVEEALEFAQEELAPRGEENGPTQVGDLSEDQAGQTVLVRGRVHTVRGKGSLSFLFVRRAGRTVQCVVSVNDNVVSKGMIKFVTKLIKESIVDVEGVVIVPTKPVEGTSQPVELHVTKIHSISKAAALLPINLEDASRSEVEFEKGEQEGIQYVRVGQDTRLNNRVIELRTPANQAIFRIQSRVTELFRQDLLDEDFVELHTPKILAGASEGGSSVFKLDYMGQPACLAQSPQLHKQMAICADFGRVFEIGPVFRAEDSNTHRHLCEFTGLDFEMEIHEHYFEVLDVLEKVFLTIFDGLNEKCAKQLTAINEQYPFEPLQYLRQTLRLTFAEGVAILKEAGVEVDPMADFNTETEKKIGKLVKQKYKTDFYILHRYPAAIRPFYTMPCWDDKRYSNSFDVFIRGEEIISGAQRIHDPDLLTKRAAECGIDVKSLSTYIDSFRYGAPPLGGAGVGLERVVMLYCALNNIRKSSAFPRDPQRLAP